MAKGWTRQIVSQAMLLRNWGQVSDCRAKFRTSVTSATYVKPPSTNSNIFVPDPSTNQQVNQLTDQFAVLLGPKSSSVPGQLNLSNIHVPQQSLPQFKFHDATQLPNNHLPINFSPFPSRNVNRPPTIAPQYLVNSQVPVIPTSIAPQVPTLDKTPRNTFRLPPAHPLPKSESSYK